MAHCASRLLSDDPWTLATTCKDLKEAQSADAPWSTDFARLVEELAIYQQGSIIKKLLKQALNQSSPASFTEGSDAASTVNTAEPTGPTLAEVSLFVLRLLAESQAVALFSLRDGGVAEKLQQQFTWNLSWQDGCLRTTGTADDKSLPFVFTFYSLLGLANYARASAKFRQLIKDNEALLPALKTLFKDDKIKRIGEGFKFASVRQGVVDLILSLTLAKDSQEWMIEKGFLTLLAPICATDRHDTKQFPATAFCAIVLWRLCDSPTLSKWSEKQGSCPQNSNLTQAR